MQVAAEATTAGCRRRETKAVAEAVRAHTEGSRRCCSQGSGRRNRCRVAHAFADVAELRAALQAMDKGKTGRPHRLSHSSAGAGAPPHICTPYPAQHLHLLIYVPKVQIYSFTPLRVPFMFLCNPDERAALSMTTLEFVSRAGSWLACRAPRSWRPPRSRITTHPSCGYSQVRFVVSSGSG